MTECNHCIHYRVFPKKRCDICISTRNIRWELKSTLDECEYFEPIKNIVETSEYKASQYQPPKECNINQTTFGSE